MILYSDKYIAVYEKLSGEDSEKLPLPEEMKKYNAIYRLDKPVHGLLVLKASGSSITLDSDGFDKTYIAVVDGVLEEKQGRLIDYLYHDKRTNKTFTVKRMRKGVKEAVLDYEVLGVNSDKNISLVRIKLQTGRTHQIRIQFASRKHPLYGDGKYGSRHKGLPALCCNHLEFVHPINNSPMVYDVKPTGEPWDLFDI